MIKLHLQTELDKSDKRFPSPDFFNPLLEIVFEVADFKPEKAEISLVFVNDKQIQELNKNYRQKNNPTDVLSFLYSETGNRKEIDGEIFISLDTAQKQAEKYEQTFCSEIARLFVHGIVHLLDFDHEIESQKEFFFLTQEKALKLFQKTYILNTNCIQNI